MMKTLIILWIFIFFAVRNLLGADIFSIGSADAKSTEFNDFNIDFNAARFYFDETKTDPYAESKKFFSKPIVFDVEKDKLSKIPFVFPVNSCEWADISFKRVDEKTTYYSWDNRYAKNKSFPATTINFELADVPKDDLYFKLGFIDKAPRYASIEIDVNVNKQNLPKSQAPYSATEQNPYPCFENILFNSKTWGIPECVVIKIPAKVLKKGKNEISFRFIADKKIHKKNPQWLAIDYIKLADTSEIPVTPNFLEQEGKKALKALGCDKIVFSARAKSGDVHWYGNFGKFADVKVDDKKIQQLFDRCAYAQGGGKLVVLDLKSGSLKTIIDDSEGSVRDPVLHFDAKKLMFSYRKGGSEHYRIYETDIEGKKITPLPFWEKGYDDIEPCYLPNEDITFVSSRCKRMVPCWAVDVAILHRYYAEENVVRPISVNVDQDNSPSTTADGRILYMKWEYVHKNQMNFHGLWKKDENGANDMVFFANDIPNHLFIDAKQIPDTNSYTLTFSEWHGTRDHLGRVAFLHSPRNPADASALKIASGESIKNLSYPYPISKDYVLTSDHSNILILDSQGHIFQNIKLPKEFVDELKNTRLEIKSPIPIKPYKRGKVSADMADYDVDEATVAIVDVSMGRNMLGIKKGDIKKLLLSEILPLACHVTGGMEPITILGTFSLERPLGTVNVEEDGSAHFKVPANRALSFTALDKNGNAIKKMQSFVNFVSGTTTSCIGCHEQRDMAPPPIKNKLIALRRPADNIKDIDGVKSNEVLDFVRDIQPLLSKYCIDCHNPQKYCAKIDLTEGMGPMFARSYYALYMEGQIIDGYNRNGNMPPYQFGSGSSKILKKFDGSHKGVKATTQELNLLKTWLDTGAIHAGSIACAESGMLGSYYQNRFFARDKNWQEIADMNKVFQEHCASCHSGNKRLPDRISYDSKERKNWHFVFYEGRKSPRVRLSSAAVFNLTHPKNSAVLCAPLSTRAGGRASSKGHPVIFKSPKDERYKIILKAIEKAKNYVDTQNPRYDSPNYVPQGAYLTSMQRFGIIKKDKLKNFNVFECDKKYWDMVINPKPFKCKNENK